MGKTRKELPKPTPATTIGIGPACQQQRGAELHSGPNTAIAFLESNWTQSR